MTGPLLPGGAPDVYAERQPMEALLRELVRRTLRPNPLGRPARASDGPLLDVEIEGMRVIVVPVSAAKPLPVRLSPREREVARLVAEGFTNHRIADELGISAWTVSTHLRRMFNKLDVTNRAALVASIADSIGPNNSIPRARIGN